jgi:hypothetical protein
MYQDLCSATRDDLAFPAEIMQKIRSADVKSVLQMEPGEKGIVWFCVTEVIRKTTKNNKSFCRIAITDEANNSGWLRVWGEVPQDMEPYSIWLGNVSNDPSWGPSTNSGKIKQLIS